MNMNHDKLIRYNVKLLAKKECANYAGGYCLPYDRPCRVVNPAYKAIRNGAVNCDYFLFAVLPLWPELSMTVWREIFDEAGVNEERWKECVRCHKPFIPASNRQRYCAACGNEAKRARSIEKQRRYRARKRKRYRVTF